MSRDPGGKPDFPGHDAGAGDGPQAVHGKRTSPLSLIVNADDWGRNLEVNRQIFELLRCGKLTSTSILANGPEIEDALILARRLPDSGFGVHLNCTEYRPLTNSLALKALLDESGDMKAVIREIRITPSLVQAVYEEWSAQIARIAAAGVRINHIDSHHHSHNLPRFLPVLRALRKRFDIPRARITMNIFGKHEQKSRKLLVMKKLYNTALRHFCGFRTSDGCGNFDTFLDLSEAHFAGMSVIELMTHPGHISFEPETQRLAQPWSIGFPYRLISYDAF